MIEKGMTLTCVNDQVLPGNDVKPAVELSKTYTLLDIHICECGQHHFDIGLPLKHNWVTCYECKKVLPNKTHWCHPTRFKETSP